MKICIINGSPKKSKSVSELLIEYLMPFVKGNEVVTYNVCRTDFSKTQFSQIQSSEVLIFVFPLYVDSINFRFYTLFFRYTVLPNYPTEADPEKYRQ